ncbi:MAG: ATP-binding cassette domain-containing protein [Actinobacteria bacterium]|nr:ATP-binding cassette domain-containing protein [Actinomycetota bacterium]
MTHATTVAEAPNTGAPVLECHELTAGYGKQPVIHDVSLQVFAGEVVVLLGANGAGKTTTLLSLAGELPAMKGHVSLLGQKTTARLDKRARKGLGFVTEERSVFFQMSTIDNLKVARCDVEATLAMFPQLRDRLKIRGGLLSGGEQQMTSLGRAMNRNSKVLLADEVSLGLAPLIVDGLLGRLREQATTKGLGVLLVEQHVSKALKYADRAYVMHRGRIVLEGPAAEMRSRVREIEATYMGTA